jgi:bidirectional [NiFe] hydrogenase diaphorase subunit
MRPNIAKPAAPSPDKRWKILDATMRRVGQQSRGLIETLHTVQEAFGYLDETALRYVAVSLRVPLSRAYDVATFYHFLRSNLRATTPASSACYIKGASQLLDIVKRRRNLPPPVRVQLWQRLLYLCSF